jgi:hypothetical protein
MTWDGIDTDPSGSLTKVVAIDGVAIAEQMARLLSPGTRLDQLLPDPGRRGIGRYVEVHQLAPPMGDEHQHAQRLERQCGHGEQVGRPQHHAARIIQSVWSRLA